MANVDCCFVLIDVTKYMTKAIKGRVYCDSQLGDVVHNGSEECKKENRHLVTLYPVKKSNAGAAFSFSFILGLYGLYFQVLDFLFLKMIYSEAKIKYRVDTLKGNSDLNEVCLRTLGYCGSKWMYQLLGMECG